MRMLAALLLPVFLTAGLGQELVSNGGFEDSLFFWTEEVNSPDGAFEISRGTGHQPDPDYEVYIYKYQSYYARIRQTVTIPTTSLRFSASAELLATKGTTIGYYAYAAVTLEYLNTAGAILGRTMIVKSVGSYDPQNTPTQHVIRVTSDEWEEYGFFLDEELAGLPGINPVEVTRITVCLESYGNGSSG